MKAGLTIQEMHLVIHKIIIKFATGKLLVLQDDSSRSKILEIITIGFLSGNQQAKSQESCK